MLVRDAEDPAFVALFAELNEKVFNIKRPAQQVQQNFGNPSRGSTGITEQRGTPQSGLGMTNECNTNQVNHGDMDIDPSKSDSVHF